MVFSVSPAIAPSVRKKDLLYDSSQVKTGGGRFLAVISNESFGG